MAITISVETQGISDDWSKANGDFDTKLRGMLEKDQVLSAMLHLASLDTPQSEDPCPPHILAEGKAGSFGFTGQGGTIYCVDTDQEMTPHQATDMAFGALAVAPPPPMPSKPKKVAAVESNIASRVIVKRKLGWRGGIVMILAVCFLLGAVVMAFGVVSMKDRGVGGEDVLAAMTIGGALGLIGLLMVALALKSRRTHYVDKYGDPVAEDGSALSFIVMAQHLGNTNADDDGASDDYGGDDFD